MGLMIRLLLIGAVVWLALVLLRRWQQRLRDEPPPREPPPENGTDRYHRMVRCPVCGVHLPAQAVSSQGRCGKCQG